MKPLFAVAILAAVGSRAICSAEAATQADIVKISSQPANVGDAKISALAYHNSGNYDRDLGI